MVRVGLLVRLQAKPGKESEVASFLEGGARLGESGSRYAGLVCAAIGAGDVRHF